MAFEHCRRLSAGLHDLSAEGEIMLQPVYFLSHGGGPWPWLEGPFRRDFDWLEASLKALLGQLPEPPKAVSRFPGIGKKRISPFPRPPSRGWSMTTTAFRSTPTTSAIRRPDRPNWRRVLDLAGQAGIAMNADPARGFDHGTFSMLQPIYPDAQVPVVSLSMKQGYDPAAHLALGRALAPLRAEAC
jgi:hypothetical protein